MHEFMKLQEEGFAWNAEEAGMFRKDFFPPVKFPVLPHEPWVEKNIPIAPGNFAEVCRILKSKIDSGTYEPSEQVDRKRCYWTERRRWVHRRQPPR